MKDVNDKSGEGYGVHEGNYVYRTNDIAELVVFEDVVEEIGRDTARK